MLVVAAVMAEGAMISDIFTVIVVLVAIYAISYPWMKDLPR